MFGTIRLVKQISNDNSSEVWEASAPDGSKTSVTIYNQDIGQSFLENLFKSFNLAKNLHHPHIIKLLAYLMHNNRLWVLYEYVDTSLISFLSLQLEKGRAISFGDVLQFIMQVADGIDYLHNHNVRHGGLSPEQFYVSREEIKLAGLDHLDILDSVDQLQNAESVHPFSRDKIDFYSSIHTVFESFVYLNLSIRKVSVEIPQKTQAILLTAISGGTPYQLATCVDFVKDLQNSLL